MNPFADITATLTKISSALGTMSTAEKAKFDNSAQAKQLQGGLQSLGGTVTSEQARVAVNNVQKQAPQPTAQDTQINDAYSKLFQESQKQKADLAKAQADLTAAQGSLSIADQQKQQTEASAAATLIKGKKGDAVDTPAPVDSMVELAGDDPVRRAMLDSSRIEAEKIATNLDVLKRQTLDVDEDTRFMVRQIENIARQQIQRQETSNEEMVHGAKIAGLLAGRAQYSPENHSGIVQKVIQEGMALINEIEFKAMEKTYEVKKDLRDFKYKSFLEGQKLVAEYKDLRNQTILKMYESLQKEETRAREQIKFDQSQEERMASILAEELIGSSEAQIRAVALANGINAGLLIGNVRAITPKPQIMGSAGTPKSPENKNFGTSDTPDWRQFNPATGKWEKIDLGNEEIQDSINTTSEIFLNNKEMTKKLKSISDDLGYSKWVTGKKKDVARLLESEDGITVVNKVNSIIQLNNLKLTEADKAQLILIELQKIVDVKKTNKGKEQIEKQPFETANTTVQVRQ